MAPTWPHTGTARGAAAIAQHMIVLVGLDKTKEDKNKNGAAIEAARGPAGEPWSTGLDVVEIPAPPSTVNPPSPIDDTRCSVPSCSLLPPRSVHLPR